MRRLPAGCNSRISTTLLLEIGNALSRQRYRTPAISILQALETDPDVDILPLSEEVYARALNLFSSRPDKEWGMIDCVSFVVMTERSSTKALTTDVHFEQHGFRTLLREEDR